MKTVLVTGASRGIGRAIALEFAKQGWQVAINYNKSEKSVRDLCNEIRSLGASAKAFRADVSDETAVRAMMNEINEYFGGVDVLVNNAGIALKQGLFTDVCQDETQRIFDVNVFGMMNCCKAIIPDFVKKKSGKIINLSSVWGITGGSCEVVYSASKAAVIGFTKALSRELAPSGVCVNCVAPGFIDTDMNSHLSESDKELFAEEIPLNRIGTPEDVAKTIYFLASENADYITGQVLAVDGGII